MMDRLVLSDTAWERMAPLIIGRPDQGPLGVAEGSVPLRFLAVRTVVRAILGRAWWMLWYRTTDFCVIVGVAHSSLHFHAFDFECLSDLRYSVNC